MKKGIVLEVYLILNGNAVWDLMMKMGITVLRPQPPNRMLFEFRGWPFLPHRGYWAAKECMAHP